MFERKTIKQLTGGAEIDDAYLGGEGNGGKRERGAAAGTPFVTGVKSTSAGKPVRLKLCRVTCSLPSRLRPFAKTGLAPDRAIVSDGLRCFGRVTHAGCSYQAITTGGGPSAARTRTFKWVNTALVNIKAAIIGTYRSMNSKHVSRYLTKFEYRSIADTTSPQ